jgi:hypothetical protein
MEPERHKSRRTCASHYRPGAHSRGIALLVIQTFIADVPTATIALKYGEWVTLDWRVHDPSGALGTAASLSGRVRDQGVGQALYVLVDPTFDGVRLDQINIVDLSGLRVSVIDSFGGEHLVDVKPGEKLEKPT